MPSTSLGIRYPSSTSAPNAPQDFQNLANDVNALIGPKGQPSLTPAGGWNAPSGIRYWKGPDGLVHLVGTIVNTTTFTPAGDLMTTLPTGFRPAADVVFPVFNSSTFPCFVRVTATGRLEAFRSASNVAIGGGSGWDLTPIQFLVA